METTTLFTTWTRLMGGHFESAYDLDPDAELNLTHDQYVALDDAAQDHLIAEADRILAPYGAQLLGNGDIIGPVDRAGDFDAVLADWDSRDELREALGMVDFDEVLEKHGGGEDEDTSRETFAAEAKELGYEARFDAKGALLWVSPICPSSDTVGITLPSALYGKDEPIKISTVSWGSVTPDRLDEILEAYGAAKKMVALIEAFQRN